MITRGPAGLRNWLSMKPVVYYSGWESMPYMTPSTYFAAFAGGRRQYPEPPALERNRLQQFEHDRRKMRAP
jgi:hypothetical protein